MIPVPIPVLNTQRSKNIIISLKCILRKKRYRHRVSVLNKLLTFQPYLIFEGKSDIYQYGIGQRKTFYLLRKYDDYSGLGMSTNVSFFL